MCCTVITSLDLTSHPCVYFQDFLWLLWALYSGRAAVFLPLGDVGAHLGADWTLAAHGWYVSGLVACDKILICLKQTNEKTFRQMLS